MLAVNPDPVVACRLLREVLRVPAGDPEMIEVKETAQRSKWVRQLEQSQLPDGSWGRFHTQDAKKKTAFRTTEEAVDRAAAMGLEPGEGVLKRLSLYCEHILRGEAQISDWYEKNESFPVLIQYIVAGRLAQIDPASNTLTSYWEFLTEVARRAFSSGVYNLHDEAEAFLQLSGVHVRGGFLESQHALWILSSRKLPESLELAFVSWIWRKPDGIRYIRSPLAHLQPHRIGFWLRSMNILSRFPSWRTLAHGSLVELWEQRDKDGSWDFGSSIAGCVEFPISESWRQPDKRRQDFSTHILVLLRKYFD